MKQGDALTLTFDSSVKALRQIDVTSWLDEPDHVVTVTITMEALPDGTSHPATIVLAIPEAAGRRPDHEVELGHRP